MGSTELLFLEPPARRLYHTQANMTVYGRVATAQRKLMFMGESKGVNYILFLFVSFTQGSFLGSATFSVGDLLRAKDERLSLSLR